MDEPRAKPGALRWPWRTGRWRRHQVPFYPFFLEGVAARPELNQGDGIHPNARGVGVIVERIAPIVLRALERR